MYLFESKVKELYGIRTRKTIANDAVGVEIEMELTPGTTDANFTTDILNLQDSFTVKTDGSLRNFGIEFVSNPMSIKDKDKMLGHWDALMSSPMLKTRIEDCPRASVHVHVNVLDKTYEQLMSILLAYTLLEGPMVAYCGKYRMGNLFALRIPEADSIFRSITRRITDFSKFSLNGDHRYSALNLVSVSKFGTVEFRSMGAVYDPKKIDTWVTGVQNLVTVASSFKNAAAVYEFYTQATKAEFIMRFLGDNLGTDILSRNLDIENLMEDGEEYAIMMLASSVDDWTHEKDFRKDKEFRDYAKSMLGYTDGQILNMNKDQYSSIINEMRSVQSRGRPLFSNPPDFSEEEPEPMWANEEDEEFGDQEFMTLTPATPPPQGINPVRELNIEELLRNVDTPALREARANTWTNATTSSTFSSAPRPWTGGLSGDIPRVRNRDDEV